MKNIHILSSTTITRFYKANGFDKFYFDGIPSIKDITYKNVYITNDERIKSDDWITDGKTMFKAVKDSTPTLLWKKIVMTTDVKLINDGIQSIPMFFLEWLVKNPKCETVETEKQFKNNSNLWVSYLELQREETFSDKSRYRIIIPKEDIVIEQKEMFANQKEIGCPFDEPTSYSFLKEKADAITETGIDAIKKLDKEFGKQFSEELPKQLFEMEQELDIPSHLRWHNSKSSQETIGYICPHTQVQCDDECCVSAENCHIKASIGVIEDVVEMEDIKMPNQKTIEDEAIDYANYNEQSHKAIVEAVKFGAGLKISLDEKEIKHIEWIYDRMENVHKENVNFDYMIKFRQILDKLKNGINK